MAADAVIHLARVRDVVQNRQSADEDRGFRQVALVREAKASLRRASERGLQVVVREIGHEMSEGDEGTKR